MMNITQTTNLSSLRVTNSYAQKKKDSVQAVLIQLHSVELVMNNNSLRVLVTNLPSLRGEVSRLPIVLGYRLYRVGSIFPILRWWVGFEPSE